MGRDSDWFMELVHRQDKHRGSDDRAVKIAVTCSAKPGTSCGEAVGTKAECFALLAAVSEAVSLFPAVSHLSLSHVSHGVCEPDGVADWLADRAVCD